MCVHVRASHAQWTADQKSLALASSSPVSLTVVLPTLEFCKLKTPLSNLSLCLQDNEWKCDLLPAP